MKLRKGLTALVAFSASVALLTGCGSNGDGSESKAETGQTAQAANETGERTDRSNLSEEQLKNLLLTDEVPGFKFKGELVSEESAGITGDMLNATNIEPPSCQKLIDNNKQLQEFSVTAAQHETDHIVAASGLYSQKDLYDGWLEAMDGCESYTLTSDSKDAAKGFVEGEELSPEIQKLLDDMDTRTVSQINLKKWSVPLDEKLDKVVGIETSGSQQIGEQKYELSEYRILGVVDGLIVTSTVTPYADFEVSPDGHVVGEAKSGQITPEAREKAKETAIQVFKAQVDKVRAS